MDIDVDFVFVQINFDFIVSSTWRRPACSEIISVSVRRSARSINHAPQCICLIHQRTVLSLNSLIITWCLSFRLHIAMNHSAERRESVSVVSWTLMKRVAKSHFNATRINPSVCHWLLQQLVCWWPSIYPRLQLLYFKFQATRDTKPISMELKAAQGLHALVGWRQDTCHGKMRATLLRNQPLSSHQSLKVKCLSRLCLASEKLSTLYI